MIRGRERLEMKKNSFRKNKESHKNGDYLMDLHLKLSRFG